MWCCSFCCRCGFDRGCFSRRKGWRFRHRFWGCRWWLRRGSRRRRADGGHGEQCWLDFFRSLGFWACYGLWQRFRCWTGSIGKLQWRIGRDGGCRGRIRFRRGHIGRWRRNISGKNSGNNGRFKRNGKRRCRRSRTFRRSCSCAGGVRRFFLVLAGTLQGVE